MRASYLTLALVPAALVAQATALPDYTGILKTATPGVEDLLKEFRPLEALGKAEALMPATLPAFEKSDAKTSLKTSIAFSGLTRIYFLGAKAAAQAGDWEKAQDFCTKAQACAKLNYEGTREALTPVIASWNAAIDKADTFVKENAERIKALEAKPGRTDQEEVEYQKFVAQDKVYNTTTNKSEKNEAAKFLTANLPRFRELEAKAKSPQDLAQIQGFKVAQDNLTQGPKTVKALQENIEVTKAEYDSCAPKIEATTKNISQEAEEIAKGVKATKVKADKKSSIPKDQLQRVTYFENLLNTPANYTSRPAKLERMNFLFRLRHHVAGTPVEAKVDEVISRVRADQDPLPSKKGGKAKK